MLFFGFVLIMSGQSSAYNSMLGKGCPETKDTSRGSSLRITMRGFSERNVELTEAKRFGKKSLSFSWLFALFPFGLKVKKNFLFILRLI